MGDRSLAQRRFDKICGTLDGLRKLSIARDAYAAEVAKMYRLKTAKGESLDEIGHYVLHLCTFLGRWEDYFEERTEVLHDEVEEQPRPNPNREAAQDFARRQLAKEVLVDLSYVRKDPR